MISKLITWQPFTPSTWKYYLSQQRKSSSNEHSPTDITKQPLLKSPKNTHMYNNSPKNCPPLTLKVTLYFNFKKGRMPFDPPSKNSYQQTRTDHHTKSSNQNIMIYLNFSHQTPIQSQPHQRKTIKHSWETFNFTLPRIKLFVNLQHQNCTSNLSLKWILTIGLTFLLLLYFPWALNL